MTIVKTIKNNLNLILNEVNRNTPIIIVKNLLNTNDCKKIISICHKNSSIKYHRKKNPNKYI